MGKLYRPNAGIVIFNREGKVLVLARADKEDMQWQFPQGGIDDGELPIKAAIRELQEETGIENAKVIYAAKEPIKYDFPPHVLEKFKALGRSNIGQIQFWFLFFFEGDDAEINLCAFPEEIEFKAYEWIEIDEAVVRIVDFKKQAYTRVAAEFKPVIAEFISRLK